MNDLGDNYQVIALDVGEKRIGVARAQIQVGLVEPLAILKVDGQTEFETLKQLFAEFQPAKLIVGLPVGKDGQIGPQAQRVKVWVELLIKRTALEAEIIYQDETLTSLAARDREPARQFIDDLAAAVILEDYLG